MDEPWLSCLELAWEAYLDGTIPVGAVIVAADGAIVARGRNRVFSAPDGSFAGTRLAHAEIDALVQLPSTRRYRDYAIYSALEPCLLCLGAAVMSTIGRIVYAAPDAYGGACALGLPLRDLADGDLTLEGPIEGDAARVSATLQAAFWLRRTTDTGPAIAASFGAEVCARAERLLATPLPRPFDDALPELVRL